MLAREAKRRGCSFFAVQWGQQIRDVADAIYIRSPNGRHRVGATVYRVTSSGDRLWWAVN